MQQLEEINIREETFIHALMLAFLCSYLDCKRLLIDTGFLQQPSASWGLCQEESDVHGRNFFPLNTGVCLDVFFMFPQHTPLPSPGSQSSVAGTRWLPPAPGICHSAMTVAAHAFRADGITQPQLTAGRWESLTLRQSGWPVPPGPGPGWPQTLCLHSTMGSGALSMKDWLIFLVIPSSRLKGQREDCQCMAVPQIKTINSLVFPMYLCFLRTEYQMKEIRHAFFTEQLL